MTSLLRRDFVKRGSLAVSALFMGGRSAFPLPPGLSRHADFIFLAGTTGTIITMNEAMPQAEALALRGNKILAVGTAASVQRHKGPGTQIIDLNGRTLLPGFIDAHMHTAFVGQQSWLDVGPLSTGTLTIQDALAKIATAAAALQPGQWLFAKLLDPALQPGDPVTSSVLDGVAPNNPLFLIEDNQHVAYVNTKAFEAVGITKSTPAPPQSRYVTDSNGELTGELQEFPAFAAFFPFAPQPTGEAYEQAVLDLFDTASANGCTALHDAGLGLGIGTAALGVVKNVMKKNPPLRLTACLVSDRMAEWEKLGVKPFDGDEKFKVIGMKFWTDGSLQAKSGYLSEPYLGTADNVGFLNYTTDVLIKQMAIAQKAGWPLEVHCNGDAAIDTGLIAFASVLKEGADLNKRHRIEHCTLLYGDQIKQMQRMNLSPCFLIGHVYYWGSAFRDVLLGADRANHLDPCNSALDAGLRISLTSDWNVTPLKPLSCIQNAVVRGLYDVTTGDAVPDATLNPAECITVEQAIKAVTLDAAWQCHIDHICGSLVTGKLGDLVILEDDPTGVSPDTIGDIAISETWFDGVKRYPGPAGPVTFPNENLPVIDAGLPE